MANKKDFKSNPALNFMTAAPDLNEQTQLNSKTENDDTHMESKTHEQNERAIKKIPEGYKINHEFIETKSKRVQCLLQPSVVEKLKGMAQNKGISMNEAINEAIHMYMNV